MPKVDQNREERAQALTKAIASSVSHLLHSKGGELDEGQKLNMRIGAAIIKQATPRQLTKAVEESILAAAEQATALHTVGAGKQKGA